MTRTAVRLVLTARHGGAAFRLMTMNVGESYTFQEAAEAARATVACFQELNVPQGEGYYPLPGNTGRAFYTALPVLAVHEHSIRVRLPTYRTALIANVHLSAGRYGPYECRDNPTVTEEELIAVGEAERGPGLQAALEELEERRLVDELVLLAGDFNEPSHLDWTAAAASLHFGRAVSWPMSRRMHAAGFVDAYRQVHPDEVTLPANTWTPKPGPDEVHDRIDFVYAADLEVEAAQVMSSDGPDLVFTPWGSDHRAVIASFAL